MLENKRKNIPKNENIKKIFHFEVWGPHFLIHTVYKTQEDCGL